MDKKQKTTNSNKFLEILRGLEAKPSQQASSSDYSQKQSGELKPNQTLTFEETKKAIQKERFFRKAQGEFWDLRRQENLLFTRNERETRLQVEAIQEELKKLALSTKNLTKEVEIAAKQVPVEPGVYHLNFFEKLRQSLVFLRKKVEESATWLAAFNQRAKKRNYYWGQVKKSGTKFMLSQERYMSTQFG